MMEFETTTTTTTTSKQQQQNGEESKSEPPKSKHDEVVSKPITGQAPGGPAYIFEPDYGRPLSPALYVAKARPTPYSKPILLTSDRRSRKQKKITWQNDEKILKVHYFEYIADERVNVTRLNNLDSTQVDPNASTAAGGAAASPAAAAPPSTTSTTSTGGNSSLVVGNNNNNHVNKLPTNNSIGGKIANAASVNPIRPIRGTNAVQLNGGEIEKFVEYMPWRPLVLIDFTPELPSPGWNSIERSAQAERETYVLGAIDLPGQPSTLDEPDNQSTAIKPLASTTVASDATGNNNNESGTNNKDDASNVKIIPLENPEGMFTEYPDMYSSEIVNGLRVQQPENPQSVVQNTASFCNQQSQLLPNQFQQQLANVAQNPFTFREMSAQFHQQQQQQHHHQQQHLPQFPYPQQQQQQAPPPLPFQQQQQTVAPFVGNQLAAVQQQQQQQQALLQPIVDQQPNLTGPIMPWLSYPFNQVNENSHTHLFRRPAT